MSLHRVPACPFRNLKSVLFRLLLFREASGSVLCCSPQSVGQACPVLVGTLLGCHPSSTACSWNSSWSPCWAVGSWVSLSARTTYLGKTHGGSAAAPLALAWLSVPRIQRGRLLSSGGRMSGPGGRCIKGRGSILESFPELSAWVAVLG